MLKAKYTLLFILIICVVSALNANETKWYKVISIIDGDTLHIQYNGRIESVRLYGIDAPERNTKGFFKAAAVLEELCYGKYIRLVFRQKNHRDKYNRLLAEIYLKDNTRVNEELYRRGVVKLYRKSPLVITK